MTHARWWLRSALAVVISGLLLGSQAAAAKQGRVKSGPFVFACERGYRFSVRFEGNVALLALPNRTVRLPRARSASGARYSDGRMTFWNKGDRARLEMGNRKYVACRVERKRRGQ